MSQYTELFRKPSHRSLLSAKMNPTTSSRVVSDGSTHMKRFSCNLLLAHNLALRFPRFTLTCLLLRLHRKLILKSIWQHISSCSVSDSNNFKLGTSSEDTSKDLSSITTPVSKAMASITTSNQPWYTFDRPEEEVQRGRKRRRSSAPIIHLRLEAPPFEVKVVIDRSQPISWPLPKNTIDPAHVDESHPAKSMRRSTSTSGSRGGVKAQAAAQDTMMIAMAARSQDGDERGAGAEYIVIVKPTREQTRL